MRWLPGIDPGRLPVLAALAAATGFTALLGATVAVYLAADLLGSLMLAGFLLAGLGLAASGWRARWQAGRMPAGITPETPHQAVPQAGEDLALLRIVEAASLHVKSGASTLSGLAEVLGPGPGMADTELRRQLAAESRSLLAFAIDLHDYVRSARGRLRIKSQQVDAGELVAAALAACRAPAERAGTVIVAHVFDGVELTCDAERIGRALTSLVLWAVDTVAPGSAIDVGLLRLADGGLAIDVSARGALAAAHCPVERLFEPQLTPAGLEGLALPIARRVALLHSGEATAAVTAGEGCSARLTLPAQRVAWPEAEGHRPARAA